MTLNPWAVVTAIAFLFTTHALAQDVMPSNVGSEDLGSGRLFVNDDGLTLYTYKRDLEQPGTSTCVDACAKTWPPVPAPSAASPIGEWSAVERPNGSFQWAYKGQPVYTYVLDTHPGAIVGEKASGFWDVLYEPVDTPPGISIQASVKGQMLINALGFTIYSVNPDQCDSECFKAWLPVEAPWMARPVNADWTITRRSDGLSQWVYKGQALYTFEGDTRPAEMNGEEGIVVVLQPAPAIPSWVTFQETDIGPVMADENRMTLYYLVEDMDKIRRETCDNECIEDNWIPSIAPSGTQPIANWSTAELEDGQLQWTYMGLPVYTFRNDKMPGDIYGDKFGTGSQIRGGWNAILQETLIQKLSS